MIYLSFGKPGGRKSGLLCPSLPSVTPELFFMKCLSQLFPCGLLLLAVSSQPALAEDVFSTVMQGGFLTKENWTVTLGAGAIYGPKYEGSAESSVSPVPFVEINWNDTIFLSPGDGLGVNLYQSKGFVVGTSVGYDGGRQESDSRSELRGLGDIDAGVSTSGFWPRWRL